MIRKYHEIYYRGRAFQQSKLEVDISLRLRALSSVSWPPRRLRETKNEFSQLSDHIIFHLFRSWIAIWTPQQTASSFCKNLHFPIHNRVRDQKSYKKFESKKVLSFQVGTLLYLFEQLQYKFEVSVLTIAIFMHRNVRRGACFDVIAQFSQSENMIGVFRVPENPVSHSFQNCISHGSLRNFSLGAYFEAVPQANHAWAFIQTQHRCSLEVNL